jgi:hypothetical protein
MSLKNTSFFNPTSITGCSLWLDGADPAGNGAVPANGATVSTWVDKSGTGNNGTSYGNPTFVTSAFNGKPSILFNGSTQRFVGAITNTGNTVSVFAIVSMNSGGQWGRICSLAVTNNYDGGVSSLYFIPLIRNSTNQSIQSGRYQVSGNVNVGPVAITYNVPFQAASIVNGTTNILYLNGTSAGSVSSTGNFGYTAYGIGAQPSDLQPEYFQGYISEILVFHASLSTTQRQQIEGYLAWKWRLTSSLPASHPYALSPSFGIPSIVPNAPAKTSLTYANHPVVTINGCALWFDGADPLGNGNAPANGTSLTTWVNKGITTVTLAHGTSQPTYSTNFQNGLGSVSFNNNYFSAAYSFNLQTKSAFIVCSQSNNATDSPQGILSFYGAGLDTVASTNGYGYQATQGGYGSFGWLYNIFAGGSTGYYIATGTAGANTPMGIYGNVFSNQFEQTFKDGSSVTNFTISTTPGMATNLMVGARLIGGGLRGSFFGNICEIIVYNVALSTAQRQTIEGYLAQKWGLTANLPAGHPFKSSFPLFPSPVTGVRRVANRRWSPLTPGNCQLWLDAADSSTFTFTTGNFISVWRDKSTFNNGGTVNTTPKPFLRVTSPSKQSSLFFDGTCGIPLGSSFTSSLCSNFIIVFAPTPAAQLTNAQYAGNGYDGQMLLINGGAGGGEIQIQPDSMRSLIGSWKVSSFPSRVESFCIGQFEFNYGTLLMNLWQNGTLAASTAFSNGTATAPTQLGISEYFATFGVAPYIGDVAEIIYYSVSLSNPQRQQVEGYLAWKWGLKASLPSSHPYKLFPPSP